MMDKNALVRLVAEKAKVSVEDAEPFVSATFDAIMEAIAAGQKIRITGFGSFETRLLGEREATDPRTGKPIKLPAVTIPTFSAGMEFKKRVASGH